MLQIFCSVVKWQPWHRHGRFFCQLPYAICEGRPTIAAPQAARVCLQGGILAVRHLTLITLVFCCPEQILVSYYSLIKMGPFNQSQFIMWEMEVPFALFFILFLLKSPSACAVFLFILFFSNERKLSLLVCKLIWRRTIPRHKYSDKILSFDVFLLWALQLPIFGFVQGVLISQSLPTTLNFW